MPLSHQATKQPGHQTTKQPSHQATRLPSHKATSLLIALLLIPAFVLAQSTFPIPRISPIPIEVEGLAMEPMSLDGTWKFNPVFEPGFMKMSEASGWADIAVPGEWAMQGFVVDSAQAAGFFREFQVPTEWKNQRIKLRFNGVYSKCVVFLNGSEAGSHLGGFTAFELDVSDLVKFGRSNTLLLSVTNESLVDSLASGSRYACHPLGGITRSVSIFPLPEVNLSSLAIQTQFDSDFKDAQLTANVVIANESQRQAKELEIKLSFHPWKNKSTIVSYSPISVESILKNSSKDLKISFPVDQPDKWDCENPNLYVLTCQLLWKGKVIETVEQRFGFRQSEVVGNQLLINGKPVKLRGVNRHEVYPLTGRVVPKEMYRKDIELFREGNVNHIRTCHYPPDQALMELADELGMFIECEGPFCWSHETQADPSRVQDAITSQNLEMIVLYRNHPSVIFWSMSNESIWTDGYEFAGKAMKALDPSRPLTFNYFPWGWVENQRKDEAICAIGSDHYPSPKGPGTYADYHRPISFGEFVHLNAYNRYELATDVALRDKWGIYLHAMWEDMYKAQGVAGGSIWAGIDDTFYWDYPNDDGSIEERTVGYGTWGPIDGWRRKKPEWWGMKKTYSPIRVSELDRINSNLVRFQIENRQDFSNLNRLIVNWKIGKESGRLMTDIGPHQTGEVEITTKLPLGDQEYLELEFLDPRGFLVDSFKFQIHPYVIRIEAPDFGKQTISSEESDDYLSVTINKLGYKIRKSTGLIESDVFTGPHLMVLPLNNGGDTQMHGPTKYYEPYTHSCTDWKLDSIVQDFIGNPRTITVYGNYREAYGYYRYEFRSDWGLSISYSFTLKEDINPRQIGLVFDLPNRFENLSWKRKGYWTTYPDWHIARLEGSVKASEGFSATPVGPRTKPNHEWRLDRTAIGSNDFASTKHNIYWASLMDASGKGLKTIAGTRPGGNQHSRTWIAGDQIRLLIADYSNGGSERFLRPHAQKDDKPLKKGDSVTGEVYIKLIQ